MPWAYKVKRKMLIMRIVLVLQLGRGLVENVALWYKHGLVHRDLSVSNVGLADDGNVSSYGTLLPWQRCPLSMGLECRAAGQALGCTWLSACSKGVLGLCLVSWSAFSISSLDLAQRMARCIGRKAGREDSDAKIAAMMDARTFDAKVRMHSYLHFVIGMVIIWPARGSNAIPRWLS